MTVGPQLPAVSGTAYSHPPNLVQFVQIEGVWHRIPVCIPPSKFQQLLSPENIKRV